MKYRCEVWSNCITCATCETACPVGAIAINEEEEMYMIDQDKCIGCGACADCCPLGAIEKIEIE